MAMPEHVHDEQIKIWSRELLDAVTYAGREFTPVDYEHVVDVHEAAERAVRYLVSFIYGESSEHSRPEQNKTET
jgi:hypothetical protein